jgi:hypothetical protein
MAPKSRATVLPCAAVRCLTDCGLIDGVRPRAAQRDGALVHHGTIRVP